VLKPGDQITDRSSLTVVEDQGERALLSDKWGTLYVTDENSVLQYVGYNRLAAEIELQMPTFNVGGQL
jgi:hypothetical protein